MTNPQYDDQEALDRQALLEQMDRTLPGARQTTAPAPDAYLYGNQPGVPGTAPTTMSVTTNLDKLGADRYNVTTGQTPVTSTQTSASSGRWNPEAKAQMDEVGKKYGYQWSDAEYDQWLGPKGYTSKDDVDGTGRKIAAYSGGPMDDYWLMRMGYHARNEDYEGGWDQMRARQAAGLQDYGFGKSTSDPNSGSATARIAALFPSDMGAYQTLEQKLQQILGGPNAFDRDALLAQMTR